MATDTVTSPVRLAITGAVGFFVIGVLVSVLGPTLPELRDRHDLAGVGGGMLVAAYAVGSVLGVGFAGYLRHRVSPGRLTSVGAVALAVGSAAVPAAPSGVLAGAGLLLAGFGLGMLDLLLNLLLATGFGARSGAVLSAVSATFGVGAVLTPLVVGRSPTDLRLPYLLCAGGALALLALTTTLKTVATTAPDRKDGKVQLPLMLLLGGVLLGYVAFESGVAGWETTHLLGVTAMSPSGAANAVALFWLGLTLGRLAGASLALRLHPGLLAVGSLALATMAVAFAGRSSFAVLAYAVTGFALAPVFPAVITWYAQAVPSGRGATRVFAAGLAGPVIGSPLLGLVTDTAGVGAVPWALSAFGVVTTGAAAYCYLTRRRDTELVPAK